MLAFCVVFLCPVLLGKRVANIEGRGSLFDDSEGEMPAFVLGIDGLLLFAVEGKDSEVFFDGRK